MMTYAEYIGNRPEIDEVIEGVPIIVVTSPGWCWVEDGCHTRAFMSWLDLWSSWSLLKRCSGRELCCEGSKDG